MSRSIKKIQLQMKYAVDLLHHIYYENLKQVKPLFQDSEKRKSAIYFLDSFQVKKSTILDYFFDGENIYKFIELAEINKSPIDIAVETGEFSFPDEEYTIWKTLTLDLKNYILEQVEGLHKDTSPKTTSNNTDNNVMVMLDRTKYSKKPSNFDTAQMVKQKKLKPTSITLLELAKELNNGATFRPALLEDGGKSDKDWKASYTVALDFDHNITIDEALNKCIELDILPVFGYTSFSHSESEHKFRLVFCLPEPITNLEERNKLLNALGNAFEKSDQVTKNPSRMFYGGRTLIFENYANRISPNKIIEKYYRETNKSKTKSKRGEKSVIKSANTREDNDIHLKKIEAIRSLNVDLMRLLLHKGVLEVSNRENISLSLPPKTPTGVFPHGKSEIICKSQMELYYIINHLDLKEFTGIYGIVNCVLPNHEDEKPSGNIYTTSDGTEIYKCFGCEKSRTIISLVEELAQVSRSTAIDFIKNVYGIKFEITDRIREQQKKMIDSANFLDTEEFKEAFPYLASIIRTRKGHIQRLLMHFSQYISDDGLEYENKILFWGSYKVLMEVCEINPCKPTKLSQSLTLFALLNFLIKVPPELLPDELSRKAKHIAAKYNLRKLTNFYTFEEYGIMSLQHSEIIAKHLKDNNISIAGISREYVLRTFGLEMADKAFPQYKHENRLGTSDISDKKTVEIAYMLMEKIENNGYCFEKDIVPTNPMYSQWKRSIQEILDSYGLIRTRLNAKLKEQYKIDSNGYPFIIIRKETA